MGKIKLQSLLTRKCSHCKLLKLLNSENFNKTIYKGKPDFHRYCRECRKITRKDSYKYLSKEKQISKSKYNTEFQKNTISGRAIVDLNSYKTSDKKKNREFNIEKDWYIENILMKKCIYCESDKQIGADRIDNSKRHIKENIVPCCAVCNSVRMNIFTVEEMVKIGKTIKEIRLNRDILKIGKKSKKLIID